jgi:hypothetical protein
MKYEIVDARTKRPFTERLFESIKLAFGILVLIPVMCGQVLIGKKRLRKTGHLEVRRSSRSMTTCHETFIQVDPLDKGWVDVLIHYNEGPQFRFELNKKERREFVEMIEEV